MKLASLLKMARTSSIGLDEIEEIFSGMGAEIKFAQLDNPADEIWGLAQAVSSSSKAMLIIGKLGSGDRLKAIVILNPLENKVAPALDNGTGKPLAFSH